MSEADFRNIRDPGRDASEALKYGFRSVNVGSRTHLKIEDSLAAQR
jgi:hypothetical protein